MSEEFENFSDMFDNMKSARKSTGNKSDGNTTKTKKQSKNTSRGPTNTTRINRIEKKLNELEKKINTPSVTTNQVDAVKILIKDVENRYKGKSKSKWLKFAINVAKQIGE